MNQFEQMHSMILEYEKKTEKKISREDIVNAVGEKNANAYFAYLDAQDAGKNTAEYETWGEWCDDFTDYLNKLAIGLFGADFFHTNIGEFKATPNLGEKKALNPAPIIEQKSCANDSTSGDKSQVTESTTAQVISNLPAELLSQPRFFRVLADKTPIVKDWNNPKNQFIHTDIKLAAEQLVGFDICSHNSRAGYICVDVDHCFNDDGEFVSEEIARWVKLFFDDDGNAVTYTEKSISGRGLHFLFKPVNPAEYENFVGIKRLQVGNAAVEVFWEGTGRYILLTGNLYHCAAGTQISTDIDAVELIWNQIFSTEQKEKSNKPSTTYKSTSKTPPALDIARVHKCLKFIEPARISKNYFRWLSITSSIKNTLVDCGISYTDAFAVFDDWCKKDNSVNPAGKPRYNPKKNRRSWNALNNPNFNIDVLIKNATEFGYDDDEFQRQWYEDNPQFSHYKQQYTAQEDFKGLEKTAAQVEKTPNNEIESEKTALPDDLFNAIFSADITDYGNALRLWTVCKDNLRFSYDIDKWMSYDGHIWEVCNGDSIIFYHAQTLIKMLRENAGKSKERRKIATIMASESKIARTKRHLKGLHSARITQKDLDNYPFLLNCQNGIVDLSTGLLHPSDATKYLTQIVNAEYRADYHNDIVDKFLTDILPDDSTRAGLLCFLGYCLTGDVSQDKAMFFSGGGGNGKSTLLETLIYLLGSYSAVIPSQVLTLHRYDDNGESATPALVSLKSARLAVSDEIKDNQRLDVQKFKLLTGGNVFKARNLHEKAIDIQPTHKLIICGNSDLQLQNVFDAGLQRRLMRIVFNQSFSGEKLNTRLRTQLREKDNLDALLSLLVKHSMKYLTLGRLLESDAMILAKQEYLQDNNFIGAFFAENTADDDNSRIALQDIIGRIKYRCPKDTIFLNDRTLRTMIRQALNSFKDDNGKPKYTEISVHKQAYFQGLKWIKVY